MQLNASFTTVPGGTLPGQYSKKGIRAEPSYERPCSGDRVRRKDLHDRFSEDNQCPLQLFAHYDVALIKCDRCCHPNISPCHNTLA